MSDIEFKRFVSIDNAYKTKVVNQVRMLPYTLGGGLFAVRSKIDGANFAFYVKDDEMKIASRNQFVDGTFYNSHNVIEKYREKVFSLYNSLRSLHDGRLMIITGELYGEGIQNRVNYGEKDFCMFQIEVMDKGGYMQVMGDCILEAASEFIPTAPLLAILPFEEAINYNNTYRSLLTPDDHEGDNYEEGIVITPVIPQYTDRGQRVILKSKSDKFTETEGGKVRKRKEVEPLPEALVPVIESISALINENRVLSATSKIGMDFSLFGQILKEVVKDVMDEWKEDNEITPEIGQHFAILMKEINKTTAIAVRTTLTKHS